MSSLWYFQFALKYSWSRTKWWVCGYDQLINLWRQCFQYAIWSGAMIGSRPSSKKAGGGLKPCKAAATTVNDFANATSIHGISYIFDNTLLILERILWFVFVAFFSGLCAYWIVQAYMDWQRNPMITSVSSTGNTKRLLRLLLLSYIQRFLSFYRFAFEKHWVPSNHNLQSRYCSGCHW